MKRIGKTNIVVILLSIALIIYLVLFSIEDTKLFKKLDNEGVMDTAVTVREFTGAKRKIYFEYVFDVGSNNYHGFLQYHPDYGPLEVGDSVLVKYLKDKPDDINKLMTDSNHKLIMIK